MTRRGNPQPRTGKQAVSYYLVSKERGKGGKRVFWTGKDWSRDSALIRYFPARELAIQEAQDFTLNIQPPHITAVRLGATSLKVNPVPRNHADEIEAAAKLQADFSGHEPGNVDTVKVSDAKVFTPVGKLAGVLYDTNRDGKPEKYIHRFRRKSRPLLASSHDGTELRIVGGRFRFTEAGIVDE